MQGKRNGNQEQRSKKKKKGDDSHWRMTGGKGRARGSEVMDVVDSGEPGRKF